LATARERIPWQPIDAAATLLHLVQPDPGELEEARSLAAMAGRNGLSQRVQVPGAPSSARYRRFHLAVGPGRASAAGSAAGSRTPARAAFAIDESGKVVVWTPEREAATWSFELAPDTSSLALSPEGVRLFVGRTTGELLVYAAERARPERVHVSGSGVTALALSTDGARVAVGQQDGSVTLLASEPEGWVVQRHQKLHESTSTALAWIDDVLVSGAKDGSAVIWKSAARRTRRLALSTAPVNEISAGSRGTALVKADETVWSIDVDSGAVGELCSGVTNLSVGVDGFVGFGVDGDARCGAPQKVAEAPTLGPGTRAVHEIESGRWIVLDERGELRWLGVGAGRDHVFDGEGGAVSSIAYLESPGTWVVGEAGGRIHEWWPGREGEDAEPALRTEIDFPMLYPSSDQARILVSSQEGELHLWVPPSDERAGASVKLSEATDRAAYSPRWSHDGGFFAGSRCCDEGGRAGIGLWTADGTLVGSFLASHAEELKSLLPSPDGSRVYVDAGGQQTAFVHDLRSGKERRLRWQGLGTPHERLAESWPRGKGLRIFTREEDSLVLWESGLEGSRMHAVEEIHARRTITDSGRSACLFRAEEGLGFMLWRLEDDVPIALQRTEATPRAFSMSADRRWLILDMSVDGTAIDGVAVDLETGFRRPIPSPYMSAGLDDRGGIGRVVGSVAHVQRRIEADSWDALRAWIEARTDTRLEVGQLVPGGSPSSRDGPAD
jgi:WD40 repeat protein